MKNKKALIVDDEEKARLYLASILSELHPEIEIQFVSSPAEALFLLQKQHFDIVFLDVEMPGMTGLEMLENLHESLKNIPFIFVSAYKHAEYIQKALRLNAVDYIDKPVNPTELENAINKAFTSNSFDNSGEIEKILSNKIYLLTDIDERLVETENIVYFQSCKRYSIAYFTDGTNRIVRYNLVYLSSVLPKNIFLRASRQYLINVQYIKFISKTNKSIKLEAGKQLLELRKIFPHVLSKIINDYSLKI